MKAIIVGGGPVGLTAALALTRAKIDFVLLEQRSQLVLDAGSNLVLSHKGQHALRQLGLSENLARVTTDLNNITRIDHEGRSLGTAHWFELTQKRYGTLPNVISRHDLSQVLHDGLPAAARSQLLANKKVADVAVTDDGVTVTCTDNTSYQGDFIIGADGTHSAIRRRMRQMTLDSGDQAAAAGVDDEQPFLTTYRCLWMRIPTPPGLEPGTTAETHGKDASTQLFAGHDSTVLGVYEKLAAPTRDRIRFSDADERDIARRWGHLPLIPALDLTLGSAYERRSQAGLVSLEEGVVKQWSWAGRIVLVGDAAHKFTPSTGAGCNNGIVDVVALANRLHALQQEASGPSPASPAPARLASVFRDYQDSRREAVVAECEGSSNSTAMSTWANGFMKFLDTWVFSQRSVQWLLVRRLAAAQPKLLAFSFIPEDGH